MRQPGLGATRRYPGNVSHTSSEAVACRQGYRCFPRFEQQRRVRAAKGRGTRGDLEPVADRDTNHRSFRRHGPPVADTLFAGFTLMPGRQRVGEVRVNLEREQPQRIKSLRIDNRHIVGGANGRAGEV